MASPRSALDRLLPTKSLFSGPALVGLILSVVAALLMSGVLGCGALLVDLFVTRGVLDEAAAAKVRGYFLVLDEGAPDQDAESEPGEDENSGDDSIPSWHVVEWAKAGDNRGLLPVLAHLERSNSVFAGPLAGLIRGLPPLRTNALAAVVLPLSAVFLLVLRAILLHLARGQCRREAIGVTTRLRRSLHRHALRLGPGDLRNRAGDTVLKHFTEDVGTVGDYVLDWTYRIGRSPVEIAVLFVVAMVISPLLTLQCLIPLGGCWYLVHHEMRRRDALRKLGVDRAERDLKRLAESLRNTRLVRGFGMENHEHEQFAIHLERYQRDLINIERGETTSVWAVRVLVAATLGVVTFLVGWKILASLDDLTLGEAAALLVAFGGMSVSLEALWALPDRRRRAAIAADAIQRYLDEMPEVSQAVGAKFLEPLSEQLRFEGVRYETRTGESLLDDFTCSIRAGDVVAIVSLDQIQARAVTYLLPRFIEPNEGRVVVDGEDIAWVTLESLRAETIFVGGDDVFFTGTVLENIACGQPNFKLPDVTEAAKTAHAHNFVQKLAAGYETILGERGEHLDPGEAFRLGLARAVLRDPALLIVEEPDSPLDADTKALVDDSYDRILPGRTVILLPTRLTTLKRARRVIVVHDGKVVADGHHDDLVKSSAVYRHWEYTRFNEYSRNDRG